MSSTHISPWSALKLQMSSLTLNAGRTPSPLGQLASLPAEVRQMVFKACIANNSAIKAITICKQLHQEFTPLLYEAMELAFHIDPTNAASEVKILGWGKGRTVASIGNHRDTSSIVEKMPFDRFGGIQVIVEPPDPRDTGQLVRCWRQCTSLMEVLLPQWFDPDNLPRSIYDLKLGRRSERLPPVVIEFVEGGDRYWSGGAPFTHSYRNGEMVVEGGMSWNHSVPSYKAGVDAFGTRRSGKFEFSDLDMILRAFYRIRCADSLKIRLPPSARGFEGKGTNIAIARLVGLAKAEKPFGIITTRSDFLDVHWVLSRENAIHLWLEYLLDDLDGPAAALLRRQRFQDWCSEAEHLHFQRLIGFDFAKFGGHQVGSVRGEVYMDSGMIQRIKSAFRARFRVGLEIQKEIVDDDILSDSSRNRGL
ncbi:hypothetical protein H2200_011612 [Cladophialophora chaetospira]|uniref:Uncharacterized protein n=1 Tax=Cladophialophora chaetospira TaxID=386627 RepID=A0AA38WZN5_9EURO|nr:hypothetical protein H2200_011612 [Cladophialophora chaetospira]